MAESAKAGPLPSPFHVRPESYKNEPGFRLPLGPAGVRLLAAAVIAALTAVNMLGVRAGKWTNNLLMLLKLAGIAALAALALAQHPSTANPLAAPLLAGKSPALLLTALVPI